MSAWGSPWYRAWVIGGLLVIVGVSVGLGLANPTDQRVIFAILPMLAIYMGGIFVMQARAATSPRGSPMSTRAEEPAHGADPPKGWNELSRVLAVNPIDPAAERAARKASGGVWLSQVHTGAVLDGRTPRFSVASDEGKLAAEGDAPAAVAKALEPLSADERWRRVTAEGGAEGI